MERLVIRVDGAYSGKRYACAAVVMQNGRIVAECGRNLPEAGGYALAAEIAGVALAAHLFRPGDETEAIIVETDNPDVPQVIERGFRPRQASRLPAGVLAEAVEFAKRHRTPFKLLL